MGLSVAVDLGLALIVLLSLLAGFRHGFLDSLFSLAAWVGAALLAFYTPGPIMAHLPAAVRNIPGSTILAGVAVFLVAFFVIRLIGVAVSGGGKSEPGGLDRVLGLAFGTARGVFLVGAIASLMVGYLSPDNRILRESRALPMLSLPGRMVAQVVPEPVRSRLERGWDRLEAGGSAPSRGGVTVEAGGVLRGLVGDPTRCERV